MEKFLLVFFLQPEITIWERVNNTTYLLLSSCARLVSVSHVIRWAWRRWFCHPRGVRFRFVFHFWFVPSSLCERPLLDSLLPSPSFPASIPSIPSAPSSFASLSLTLIETSVYSSLSFRWWNKIGIRGYVLFSSSYLTLSQLNPLNKVKAHHRYYVYFHFFFFNRFVTYRLNARYLDWYEKPVLHNIFFYWLWFLLCRVGSAKAVCPCISCLFGKTRTTFLSSSEKRKEWRAPRSSRSPQRFCSFSLSVISLSKRGKIQWIVLTIGTTQ